MSNFSFSQKVVSIVIAGTVISFGLTAFKYVPMWFFGRDILFDASAHVAITIFILYVLWCFIDQNVGWRIPYFICAVGAVLIIAVQRLLVNAHDELGVLLGIVIPLIAIVVSRCSYFKKKLLFS